MTLNGSAPGSPDQEAVRRTTRWIAWVVFGFALLIGFYLRVIDLNARPYENHVFRQTQTLSTIEDFARHGIDLLHPRTIYMGYPGTFVLELPVFQALAATVGKLGAPQVAVVRVLNILIGAATTWLLYLVASRYFGRLVGLFSALIYWLAPLNVIYHRSMLIDPSGVLCGLATFYLLERITPTTQPPGSPVPLDPPSGWHWLGFGLVTFLAAMIKALYLWPAVLLFLVKVGSRRFRLDAALWKVFGLFAVSGVCFLAWNFYASSVNDTSRFTRGVKPTTLLGLSELFFPGFYKEMLFHRSKRLLGGFGLACYPIGLWAAWVLRSRRDVARPLWLLILIPPSYLALFSNINRPHDYYQLIIAPFLAAVAAFGLVWLGRKVLSAVRGGVALERTALVVTAAVLTASAVYTYRGWYHWPQSDALVLKFERLCAGKFEPQSPAMVFVAETNANCPLGSDIPEFIYAANLWGFGRTVPSARQSFKLYEEYAPGFTNLEYLVFYGTEYPTWVPTNQFSPDFQDPEHRVFAFRRSSVR